MMKCIKCGEDKEPTRAKSSLCRACDSAARARKTTRRTAHRRLTLDLPVDVWDRLDAEAQANGQRIAGYLQYLVVKRDSKKSVSRNAGASHSTGPNQTESE